MKNVSHKLASMLCLFACAVMAHAQGYIANGTRAIRDSVALQDVNVLGSQKARDARSTAPKYSLSHETFGILGITDISNALHRLPGTTLRDYGGAGGMKTVSVRGFGAQHTAVVYDGVALSDCQSGQIDVSRYGIDNVGSISLTVGDNEDIFIPAKNAASAATLSISTLRLPSADHFPHVTAQMRTGAWGLANPYVRYDQNPTDRLNINVMGEYLHADNGYPYTIYNVKEKTADRRRNNRMDSWHTEANIQWQPLDGSYLSAKVYYYDNDRQLPGMVHYYVNDSKETLHDQNFFAQLGYKLLRNERWQLSWTGKYNYAITDYKDPAYSDNIKDHRYRQNEAYTSVAVQYHPHHYWTVDYSADYSFNNLSGCDVSEYSEPLRHTILQSLTAKYSTQRLTAMARLLGSLYFNGAISGKSAKDIRHLSPSVSISFKPLADESLYLRLSFKDIFRAPSFNESYYYHYGSTNLNPERTEQLNIGMTWSRAFANHTELIASLDGYYNNVKDKIVAIPFNMFIWTNVNLGKVRSLGLDFSGSISQKLGGGNSLLLSGNYTLQSITNRTSPDSPYYGLQIAYTPVHSGSASLGWNNPWISISLNGVFASCRWANNEHLSETMLRSYEEFGVTAFRDFRFRHHLLSLRLDIKNIFNHQYEIVRFYPMPGRHWQLTVKYSI